jgi:hypothetical protein
VLNCVVPAPPQPPRPAADVPPESQAFHSYWDKFGLPIPFNSLPFVVDNNPDIPGQPDNPLGWETTPRKTLYQVQGFGPSAFAYGLSYKDDGTLNVNQNDYRPTFQLHSGVDYGTNNDINWTQRVIISLCDGVIVPGNWYQSTQNLGGSASPGRGVSVRCFMDSLSNGSPDTDGDGKSNLSNIIVTYNHLGGHVNTQLSNFIDCTLLTTISCQGQYQLPTIGDVVRVNTPIGQTLPVDTTIGHLFDHLHLSTFFARGFNRNSNNTGVSFYFNPLLMYSNPVYAKHRFQNFFPYKIGGLELVPLNQRRGIGACVSVPLPTPSYMGCDLSRWSGGGFNFGNAYQTSYYSEYPQNTFWAVQTPTPPSPNHLEWPTDYYPLRPSNDPSRVTELIEYLSTRFTTTYQGPNCTISLDISRTPSREIAICNQSDLNDDTVWTVTSHPN